MWKHDFKDRIKKNDQILSNSESRGNKPPQSPQPSERKISRPLHANLKILKPLGAQSNALALSTPLSYLEILRKEKSTNKETQKNIGPVTSREKKKDPQKYKYSSFLSKFLLPINKSLIESETNLKEKSKQKYKIEKWRNQGTF